MNPSRSEIGQQIKTLTASGRRDRRKAAELFRLKETVESVTDALLLARSRVDLLARQLDLAERRSDASRITELAPDILRAVAERNRLQTEFLKLTSRLSKRFGIQTPTPQEKSA